MAYNLTMLDQGFSSAGAAQRAGAYGRLPSNTGTGAAQPATPARTAQPATATVPASVTSTTFDPEARQIQMLQQINNQINDLTRQGRTAEAGQLLQVLKDAVANGSDRVKAAFGAVTPTTPSNLGPNYNAGAPAPGTAQDVLAKAKAASDFVQSQMGNSSDVQAIIANLQTQYLAQLNALQQQITDQFNQQLGGNDPAMQAVMAQINQTVQQQRQQLLEDMSRRGLLQSGIVLEMQDRLNNNQLTAQQQALADHYSGILQQLNQALLSFAQQRLDAIQQFGMAGVNAALTQRQEDLQRTLATLNFGLSAQQQENAAAQDAFQRQIDVAQLTGTYNGQPTLNAQQLAAQLQSDQYTRAVQLAQLLGRVPQSVANILGVSAGTPTLDSQQLALSASRAAAVPASTQGNPADWQAFQNAAASGDKATALYYATQRLGMSPSEASATMQAILSQAIASSLAQTKSQLGLLSDNAALMYRQLQNTDPRTAMQILSDTSLRQAIFGQNSSIPAPDQERLIRYYRSLISTPAAPSLTPSAGGSSGSIGTASQ